MTKTVNTYVADRGEFIITVDAVMAAHAFFTTEEDLTLDGVVRKLEETTPRVKEHAETYVTGDNTPIKTISSKQTATIWTLTMLDDYSSGAAGELGTDALNALEIFEILFNNDIPVIAMSVTPAGGTTGDIETTFTNVDIKQVGHPKEDADSTTPEEVQIILVVESYAKAAHA